MVRRSVGALRAQDCDPSLFEVVVAIDGARHEQDGGETLRLKLADPSHPFALTIVRSDRPHGDIPHRNHARNAAWKAARAPLCWMLDADFILPPHAVRHVIAEHDAAVARGLPAVLSPCLWQFGGASTEQWWERSAAWADSGDPEAFKALLRDWPEWDSGVFSGFGDMATDGDPASTSVGDRMIEGMPVLWRGFLEATGGFDEDYVGWGGDKISLIDVLRGMCREGIIDLRVLTSVVAVHQPHATDPSHTDARSAANEKRRSIARMLIDSRTLEWKRRIPGLVEAVRKGLAPTAPGAPTFDPPADLTAILDGLTPMVQRRHKPGAPVVCMGAHAGQLRAHLERAGLPCGTDPKQPHAVVVLIDPLQGDDWRKAVTDLGHKLRAECHPTAAVVLSQRLDGPGLAGLQPVHLQTEVIKRSMDARTIRVGGVRHTVMCGRL